MQPIASARWRVPAVDALHNGDVLVLENTRFHAGEEANDPAFCAELAKLATSMSTMLSPRRTARMRAPRG